MMSCLLRAYAGKKAVMAGPTHPVVHRLQSDTWPLRWPRLPPCTPSDAIAPGFSPFRLFLHSPPQSSPWVRSPKPKLPHRGPTCTGGRVSQAGECRAMALTVCAGFSAFWLLQTSCCVLRQGSSALPCPG